jgi:hypothetical protein
MFFGINEIMEKARKAYAKLWRDYTKWCKVRYGTSKKSKKS